MSLGTLDLVRVDGRLCLGRCGHTTISRLRLSDRPLEFSAPARSCTVRAAVRRRVRTRGRRWCSRRGGACGQVSARGRRLRRDRSQIMDNRRVESGFVIVKRGGLALGPSSGAWRNGENGQASGPSAGAWRNGLAHRPSSGAWRNGENGLALGPSSGGWGNGPAHGPSSGAWRNGENGLALGPSSGGWGNGPAHGPSSGAWRNGGTDWHSGPRPADGETDRHTGPRPGDRETPGEKGNSCGAGFVLGEDRVEVCRAAGGGVARSAGAGLSAAGAAIAEHRCGVRLGVGRESGGALDLDDRDDRVSSRRCRG